MWFGIRIFSPFHLATQIISIQNINCPKNAKTHAWTWFLSQLSEVKLELQTLSCTLIHLIALCLDSQNIIGFSELTSNENSRRWIWMCNAFHINGRQLHIYHLWKSIPHSWKSIPKIMSAHAFFCVLGHFRLWMDMILVARWNGLEILVPKHMWKRKIRLPEQK